MRRQSLSRIWSWYRTAIDHAKQDLRYGVRGLRRSPAFTITVALTLALGIGANTAMFDVVDHLMFRPVAYLRDPSTVHRVYLQTTTRGHVYTTSIFPYTRYLDLRRVTTSFSQWAAISDQLIPVGTGQDTREHAVAAVSASLFDFFNARPVRGRFFSASEDAVPVGALVTVLSYGFWQSAFGGRDVVGRRIQIGTLAYTIVGVAPKGFVAVSPDHPPVAFIPITTFPLNDGPWQANKYYRDYRWDWTSVIVRTKPGVSAAQASADLSRGYVASRDAARLQMPAVAPATVAHPTGIAGPLKTAAGPGAGLESKTLLWLTGVAAIVLLIACANVGNLMFARILNRRREIAVRLALGVSRRRLIGQVLTESLMLSALGCTAGILVAQWGGAALRMFIFPDGSADVITDWRTLGVACLCALAAAIATALGPSVLAAQSDLSAALRAGMRDGSYQRSAMRVVLLTVQGAMSVVLLVGAGLFVRSLDNVRTMRLGYDPSPVVMAFPNMRGVRLDSGAQVRFQQDLLGAAKRIPGVVDAAAVNSRPFSSMTEPLYVDGVDSVQKFGRFVTQIATPEYFHVMQTRIIEGRAFTDADREGTPPVTVVSLAMAHVLWPNASALGQCIRIGADTMPCTIVVGVVEDARYNSLTDDLGYTQYLPIAQVLPNGGNKLMLRVASPSISLEGLRHELQRAMPARGYVTLEPLEDIVDTQRRSWALGATMFVAFGTLALLVAAIGLYGVIAYNVAQRRHELGIRIALGARSGDVAWLTVRQGLWFAAGGVGLGSCAALVASRWVQPLLFDESATDPAIYIFVGAVILLVSMAASAVPAIRATKADPNTTLRSD